MVEAVPGTISSPVNKLLLQVVLLAKPLNALIYPQVFIVHRQSFNVVRAGRVRRAPEHEE